MSNTYYDPTVSKEQMMVMLSVVCKERDALVVELREADQQIVFLKGVNEKLNKKLLGALEGLHNANLKNDLLEAILDKSGVMHGQDK